MKKDSELLPDVFIIDYFHPINKIKNNKHKDHELWVQTLKHSKDLIRKHEISQIRRFKMEWQKFDISKIEENKLYLVFNMTHGVDLKRFKINKDGFLRTYNKYFEGDDSSIGWQYFCEIKQPWRKQL